MGLLAALSPDSAVGQQVPKDDARLKAESVNYPSPVGTGSVMGYLARPANAGTTRLPTILAIHENRGLNPHIEDITLRLALDGFMAFAPDALTPLRGSHDKEERAVAPFATLDRAKILEDFVPAVQWAFALVAALSTCCRSGCPTWQPVCRSMATRQIPPTW